MIRLTYIERCSLVSQRLANARSFIVSRDNSRPGSTKRERESIAVLLRGPNARKGEREDKKKTPGETERDENVRRRTSIRGVRGRTLSTYRMHRRLLGPPTTLAAGRAKDGLDFVLLTFSSDKHSARRDRPASRPSADPNAREDDAR